MYETSRWVIQDPQDEYRMSQRVVVIAETVPPNLKARGGAYIFSADISFDERVKDDSFEYHYIG